MLFKKQLCHTKTNVKVLRQLRIESESKVCQQIMTRIDHYRIYIFLLVKKTCQISFWLSSIDFNLDTLATTVYIELTTYENDSKRRKKLCMILPALFEQYILY